MIPSWCEAISYEQAKSRAFELFGMVPCRTLVWWSTLFDTYVCVQRVKSSIVK
jgi:hypothetical protein